LSEAVSSLAQQNRLQCSVQKNWTLIQDSILHALSSQWAGWYILGFPIVTHLDCSTSSSLGVMNLNSRDSIWNVNNKGWWVLGLANTRYIEKQI
jgi:hypothetical protein